MTASTVYLLKGLSDEQKAYVMSQLATKEKILVWRIFVGFWNTLFLFRGTIKKRVIFTYKPYYNWGYYLGDYRFIQNEIYC